MTMTKQQVEEKLEKVQKMLSAWYHETGDRMVSDMVGQANLEIERIILAMNDCEIGGDKATSSTMWCGLVLVKDTYDMVVAVKKVFDKLASGAITFEATPHSFMDRASMLTATVPRSDGVAYQWIKDRVNEIYSKAREERASHKAQGKYNNAGLYNWSEIEETVYNSLKDQAEQFHPIWR